jgi:hypothetical protein
MQGTGDAQESLQGHGYMDLTLPEMGRETCIQSMGPVVPARVTLREARNLTFNVKYPVF